MQAKLDSWMIGVGTSGHSIQDCITLILTSDTKPRLDPRDYLVGEEEVRSEVFSDRCFSRCKLWNAFCYIQLRNSKKNDST